MLVHKMLSVCTHARVWGMPACVAGDSAQGSTIWCVRVSAYAVRGDIWKIHVRKDLGLKVQLCKLFFVGIFCRRKDLGLKVKLL